MVAWWTGLTPLNQVFWGLVVFFTTLFVWQFIASFAGLLVDTDADVGADAHGLDGAADHDAPHDLHGDVAAGNGDGHAGLEPSHDAHAEDHGGLATFRLLSVRSVLAFGMLFSWAAALYLGRDISYWRAFAQSALWGLLGMLVVAAFFWSLPRLSEEGTANLGTAVGRTGTVYLHIPDEGTGQVRVLVGDRISYVRARSASDRGIAAGTTVRVVRVVDGSTLEVEEVG